jgi:glycosyltransferase involved in cell wall biosynthesis/Tfp pilus assembly protein PilF
MKPTGGFEGGGKKSSPSFAVRTDEDLDMEREKRSKPRRYAIFHKDFPFSPFGVHSGAEMGTIHLARALSRRGAEVVVAGRITTGSGEDEGVHYLDIGPRYDVAAGLSLLRDRMGQIDALIAVTRADVLQRSLSLEGVRRRFLWLQDSDPRETCIALDRLDQVADRVVYVSRGLRRHLESEGIPRRLGAVVYNGFDPRLFYPSDGPAHPYRIVYAGALIPEKGVDLLMEAFHLLRKRLPDAELWLYGSPGLWGRRAWFDADRIRSLEPNIRFVGAVAQGAVADGFRRAALAVVPSRRSERLEPFPLSAVEAQACGCPVLVADNGGLPESVLPGKTGLVLRHEDSVELSELMHRILSDSKRLSRMRSAASAHAARNFDWDLAAARFEKLEPSRNRRSRRAPVVPAPSAGRLTIGVFYVRLPQPDRYGGDFRAYRLIRSLAEAGHRVVLVARDASGTPEEAARYRSLYEDVGVKVHVLAYVANRAGRWSQFPVETLEEALAGSDLDAAWVLWWNLALEIVPRLRRLAPRARIVVDSVDVAYLRLLRQARTNEERRDWLLAAHTKRQELEAYRLADRVLTVTEDDRGALVREEPSLSVSVVGNVHDPAPAVRGFADRRDLLFVGFYEHRPNTDAALYFVHRIWPELRRRLAGVRVFLVGNAPPPEVRALSGNDVVVTGYVPDLTPYWQGARLSLAPLRFGAGMKGKIGQAMAEGLPVVTTSVGAEGMGLTDRLHALIADDPGEFGDRVVEAYTEPALWSLLSSAGRDLARRRWSSEVVRDRLLEVLRSESLSSSVEVDARTPELAALEAERLSRIAEGYEWLELGSLDAAWDTFSLAVDRYPELASAHVGLAEVAEEKGDENEALRCLHFAIQKAGAHAGLRARLARLLRRQGYAREAAFHLTDATRNEPGHPAVARELAWIARERGESHEAARLFRSCLETSPDDGEALEGAAEILAENGDASNAHRLLLRALELSQERGGRSSTRERLVRRLVDLEARVGPEPVPIATAATTTSSSSRASGPGESASASEPSIPREATVGSR